MTDDEVERVLRILLSGDLGALGINTLTIGSGVPDARPESAVDTLAEVPPGPEVVLRQSSLGSNDDQPRLRLTSGGLALVDSRTGTAVPIGGGLRPRYRGDDQGAITIAGTGVDDPGVDLSYTLKNPNGDPVRFRAGTLRLIIMGAVYVDGATYGTTNSTTEFTFSLAEDGYTVTFALPPGRRPIFDFGIPR